MLRSKPILWAVLSFLILSIVSKEAELLEYGNVCDVDGEACHAADFRDPLTCVVPTPPTTENPTTTEDPTTTTEDPTTTTEDPTTTTEDPTTTTEDPTTTTEDPTTTTEDPTTTTEDPTTTTEDPTTTTEDPTTTTEDPTTTTEDPTTTTEDPTTTTEDPTTTTEDPTTTTEDPTTTTEDPTTNATNLELSINHFKYQENYASIADAGKCGCLPNMFRNDDLNRCVSPPSGVCDTKVNSGTQRTCTKFAMCFPTQENSTEGECYCEPDAVAETATGLCKLSHGSSRCEKHGDCDVLNLLTCRNGSCVCQFENVQKWNPKENKCGFVVGESCASVSPFPEAVCVENAVCNDDTSICTCDPDTGFMETLEKECKVSYSGECKSDTNCHPFYVCSNEACTCPEDQIYFASTSRCHVPEGSSCDQLVDTCVLHSACENGTCVCEPGYEASGDDNKCHALYGSSCSDEIPCHEDWYLDTCSQSGSCGCKENYTYNSNTNKCIGNLEEACRVDEDCFDHAICHLEECTCGGNFLPGEHNEACYTRYGESCETIDCFSGHYLSCGEDHVCTCASTADQMYDDIKGLCVALAGKVCGASGNEITCVRNATCAPVGEGVQQCTCFAGFTADDMGLCVENVDTSSANILVSGLSLLLLTILASLKVLS